MCLLKTPTALGKRQRLLTRHERISLSKNLEVELAMLFTALGGYDPLSSLQIYMAAPARFSCAVLHITAEIAWKRKSEES